jgi:hypothetical protein
MGKVRILRWVIFMSALVSFAIAPMSVGAQEDVASAVQPMANISCGDPWTEGSLTTGWNAHVLCDVYSGQVRLRADCVAAPDHYSPWTTGVGLYHLEAGPCWFGIREPIIESRY